MRFFDKVYHGIDPVNYLAYSISDGGDLVYNKPHTWQALKSHVWGQVKNYEDLGHLNQNQVFSRVQEWLEINERKGRLLRK